MDLLFKPGWDVSIVDMVLHEVTRNNTPTSQKIADWLNGRVNGRVNGTVSGQTRNGTKGKITVVDTRIHTRYQDRCQAQLKSPEEKPKKSNLGELAIQEVMNEFALQIPMRKGVFLFEDHKIARSTFVLPDDCRKVSTRAFLIFLEQRGLINSASEIERQAILAGRDFSRLRFPPD
ncbi:MAG: hypothetical protein QE278_06085 [Limnobacter sp.]|nr:hypothetical protein [Limnobacter sp.]